MPYTCSSLRCKASVAEPTKLLYLCGNNPSHGCVRPDMGVATARGMINKLTHGGKRGASKLSHVTHLRHWQVADKPSLA